MAGRTRTNITGAKKEEAATRASIDEFIEGKRHPLEKDIQLVRRAILDVDASIREEIKWNSISFRNDCDFFATVNLRSTESVQLILHTGVKQKGTAETGVHIDDPYGLIEKWPAKDRCVVTLGRDAALEASTPALSELLKGWLGFVR